MQSMLETLPKPIQKYVTTPPTETTKAVVERLALFLSGKRIVHGVHVPPALRTPDTEFPDGVPDEVVSRFTSMLRMQVWQESVPMMQMLPAEIRPLPMVEAIQHLAYCAAVMETQPESDEDLRKDPDTNKAINLCIKYSDRAFMIAQQASETLQRQVDEGKLAGPVRGPTSVEREIVAGIIGNFRVICLVCLHVSKIIEAEDIGVFHLD